MALIRKRLGTAVVGAAILSLALTACGGGSSDSGGGGGDTGGAIDTSNASGEVSYWLWDANQLPAYQQCADEFHAKNPNITVKITQAAWDDYWSKLTNGFVGGTAPDVFTDHLSKYPEFVSQEQLVPLDDTLKKDGVDTSIYQKGLADLWVGQDGKRYGLPKDFDTVSVFYNKKLIADGGYKESDLANMTWNPDDGGTYEKIIAHLTVDKNGKRGDDGGSGAAYGQTQWSMYTGTLPWQVTDKNPWGTHYNFDDPNFQKTMGWMRSLIDKGYMPSIEAVTGQSSDTIYAAGKYAMITNGSWMIGQMFGYKGIETGLAPTPTGPSGK